MLNTAYVPWTFLDVIVVFSLRILIGLVFAYFNVPILEVVDRFTVLMLVAAILKRYGVGMEIYGLTTKSLVKHVITGILCGIVILLFSVYVEKFYLSTFMLEPVQHPIINQLKTQPSLLTLAGYLLLAGIITPIAEEILYRMFTFLPLKRRYGSFGGAVISSIIFAVLHFNAALLAELITVGMGFVLIYDKSGSLVVPIAAHSTVNTAKLLMVFWGFI